MNLLGWITFFKFRMEEIRLRKKVLLIISTRCRLMVTIT